MAEFDGSYNGLLFGPDEPFGLVELRWWGRSTNVLTPDLPRYHGGLVGASYENPRDLEAVFIVRKSAILYDRLDEFFAAFQPSIDEDLPLTWEIPGQGSRQVFCRPVADGAGPLARMDVASETKKIPIRLRASDPTIYSTDLISATLTPFTSAVGFAWPAVWPIVWGAGGTGGGVFVTNSGRWETWPTFTINGPSSGTLTDPIIQNVTTGEELALTANGGVQMTPGQQLVVETHPARRSIAFATGASRRGKLSPGSVWFPLFEGDTELRFRASGTTTGATCLVEARSAWI